MMYQKFAGHEQAAAHLVYDERHNIRGLLSYSTIVITVDSEGWMTVNGLYSRTTIKHIGWFMREIGSSYQTAKQIYIDNYKMNIYTGEVLPL